MRGKHPFVLRTLPTELNHISLLEINVVLPLHYAKIMENRHKRKVTGLGFISVKPLHQKHIIKNQMKIFKESQKLNNMSTTFSSE